MRYLLYTLIIFLIFHLAACDKDLKFEKISHETIYRKSKRSGAYYLSESWIVHNYRDTRENEARIDAFVCNYVDTLTRPHVTLILGFYKYSKKYTNMETLTRRPDNISESMSHDYLWDYSFRNKNFTRKYKLKNFANRKFFYEKPTCFTEN